MAGNFAEAVRHWREDANFALPLGRRILRVHIHYYYGIRSPKPLSEWSFGTYNSIMVVYMDPLGYGVAVVGVSGLVFSGFSALGRLLFLVLWGLGLYRVYRV